MIHLLIEKNYVNNSRTDMMLAGVATVAKKKRLAIRTYTHCEDLPDDVLAVILVCASLKYASEMIEVLNERHIHPVLFGFQYLDTIYRYSELTFTYSKSMYRLTKYLLRKIGGGKTAFVGYNEDSLPDKLKLMGVRRATGEMGEECKVFKNYGNIIDCLERFEADCEDVRLIVCSNDSIAIIIHSLRPYLEQGRQICSCAGLRISDFVDQPYPRTKINYYKAGEQLAELYLFLLKRKEIYSTEMTLEFDIDFGEVPAEEADDITNSLIYSRQIIDFYGDRGIAEVEKLEQMLLKCDETDLKLLEALIQGKSYEKISEEYYFSPNTVKYRVRAMIANSGTDSKKDLVELLKKYRLSFSEKR